MVDPTEEQPIVTASPSDFLGTLNDVEVKHAPAQLFLRGDESLLRRGPRVSVVGSRQATEEGIRRTQVLCRALVQHEMVVVSGLAEGIDRTAHETAMGEGGHTIAVIGTPLDQCYPAAHRALQKQIETAHLLVSQFPHGMAVTPKNFPIRNRLMALLTDATVIVEAGEKSGTVHQGWEALRLGRLLFLMESVANDPALSWPKEFVRYGAQVLTRDNLPAVLDDVPAMTMRPATGFAEFM
jgi:DNA processing protein